VRLSDFQPERLPAETSKSLVVLGSEASLLQKIADALGDARSEGLGKPQEPNGHRGAGLSKRAAPASLQALNCSESRAMLRVLAQLALTYGELQNGIN
jgi:hypothetical protein